MIIRYRKASLDWDPWSKCEWPTKWPAKKKKKTVGKKVSIKGPKSFDSIEAIQKHLDKQEAKEVKKPKKGAVKSNLLMYIEKAYKEKNAHYPYTDIDLPAIDLPDTNECDCHKCVSEEAKDFSNPELATIEQLIQNMKSELSQVLDSFLNKIEVIRNLQDAALAKTIADKVQKSKKEEIAPEFGKRYIELD